MVKRIELTKGYEALVDDEDYDRVSAVLWQSLVVKGRYVYAVRSVRDGMGGDAPVRKIYLTAFVYGGSCRPANGDHLDCRRSNLVEVHA